MSQALPHRSATALRLRPLQPGLLRDRGSLRPVHVVLSVVFSDVCVGGSDSIAVILRGALASAAAMSHLAPRLLPLERAGARSERLDLAISITAPDGDTPV